MQKAANGEWPRASWLVGLAGLRGGATSSARHKTRIVLGFSQVGAESGWRTANTRVHPGRRRGRRHQAAVLRRPTASRRTRSPRSGPSSRRRSTSSRSRRWSSRAGTRCSWRHRTAGIPVILTDRAIDTEQTTSTPPSSARTSSRRARWPASGWSRSSRTAPARSPSWNWRAPSDPRRRTTAPRASAAAIKDDSEVRDRGVTDRRLHPGQGRGGHAGVPRRPRGHRRRSSRTTTTWPSAPSRRSRRRGCKPGRRHHHHQHRRRSATAWRRSPTGRSTSSPSAARCSARS